MSLNQKIFWGVVTLGLLFLGLFFWNRYQAIKRLQITPDYPSNFQFNNGFITFTQRLIVNNGDPVSLSISRVNLDVVVNEQYFGKCTLPETQIIGANQISAVSVTVTSTLTDLLLALGTTIFDLIKLKQIRLTYTGVLGGYGVVTSVSNSVSVNPDDIYKAIFK